MRIVKKVRNAIIITLLLFLSLLIFSEEWFLVTWDSSVDFSTVLYQLFSPLKGTGGQLMHSYIQKCIFPTIIIAVAVIFLECGVLFIRSRMEFIWEIKIFDVGGGDKFSKYKNI